ncbi:uncharacterized protein LOC131010741 isoform X2 [Salvia miltiorrhiza]|uniref:uncharacterized protein LOC131010713 isoform X2 n=1 Tax=Salvia miltiorrhiza TaxID=226208 RepID=UPI0025AD7A4C|nr:uncharacterized protein LOC131010713 isoform X2 [Salvia miltiorrhiza]XP_057794387.1 uncharacterized protein LOC131010741 isoform X2 [Salvia miltiorrhiza]
MRGFGFLCLFMLIGTAAFVYHGYSSKGRFSSNPAGFMYHGYSSAGSLISNPASNAMTLVLKSRRLKENRYPPTPHRDEAHINLEDYRPIDPVPNSKASIRPGPIQHGTPLMPYIPNPSPTPGKPQHGG